MRYLIIDTYNGQGYSDSGIIDDIELTDMSEDEAKYIALEKAREEFGERYLPQATDEELRVTFELNAIHADQGDNQGAIHFKKVEADDYGLLIRPDTNDVELLTQDRFVKHYVDMLDAMQGDRDERLEFIDEILNVGNGGAHTDMGYEILYKL